MNREIFEAHFARKKRFKY